MSDLVKRARERLNDAHMATEYLIDDMADHIEAQADRITKLEAALRRIDSINDNPAHYNADINRVIDEALGRGE